MKVLITGAGGNLGRVLAPALEQAGHTPILLDYRQIETPYTFIKADIRDIGVLREAARGVDAIVHGAALHGIHLSRYSPEEFWSLNVTGTFNTYQAALEHGIGKVVLASTMGVYGAGIPRREDEYSAATEELQLLPTDIYGESKKLSEELASYYGRKYGIRTIALRFGMFVPEDFLSYGFRLLKGGVDDRDAAQACLLALANTTIKFDAFNIMSDVPFTLDDDCKLFDNPREVMETYYPGACGVFESRGISVDKYMNMWGRTYWPIDKAKLILGFRPQYNFESFVQAVKEGNEAYYPFAGLPWWGVEDKS